MIGIGISTTPNRNILESTLPRWKEYLPGNSKMVIENDPEFRGVAITKNRSLSSLDDCEHIFLVDDDVLPLVADWWQPYVESGDKHLMYQFRLAGKPESDMRELHRDDKIVAYTHTRGAFLYIHRSVLDVVGGFDTAYRFGYEHADYANRIHNAGLTTHRAADVVGSDKLLYCYDQDGDIESSVSSVERSRNLARHRGLYLRSKTSKAYKEYR